MHKANRQLAADIVIAVDSGHAPVLNVIRPWDYSKE